jgi:hypothetical protein
MKVDPRFGSPLQRLDDGRTFLVRDAVGGEDIRDLPGLLRRNLPDLVRLASPLGGVVLGVALGGQVTAQTHGDAAGGDLGEPRDDDDGRRIDGAGQSGRESERYRQAIGHPDDDIAHDLAGREVAFNVRSLGHQVSGGGSPVTVSPPPL